MDAIMCTEGEKEGAIFERTRISFSPPSPIEHVAAANNVLVLAMSKGRLLRLPLQSSSAKHELDVPLATGDKVANIFLDPRGLHLLITTAMGDNFYFHPELKPPKPKPLPKAKG